MRKHQGLGKPICAGGVDAGRGAALLSYLRQVSRQDPYFAVVSAVLHAGSVPYHQHQRWVDAAVQIGAEEIATWPLGRALALLHGAQNTWTMAPRLIGSTRAYLEVCGREPETCPARREELLERMKQRSNEELRKAGFAGEAAGGFGPKISEMYREYLGDDNAVAVDRHVRRYLERIGAYGFPRSRAAEKAGRAGEDGGGDGGVVHPADFEPAKAALQAVAAECRVAPAQLQVGAWAKSACAAGTAPPWLHIGPDPRRPNKIVVVRCGKGGRRYRVLESRDMSKEMRRWYRRERIRLALDEEQRVMQRILHGGHQTTEELREERERRAWKQLPLFKGAQGRWAGWP